MIRKNKFKFVLQKYDYDCGVAASATLLLNAGVKSVNYKKLGKDLKVSKMGVISSNISEYFLKIKKLKPRLKVNSTIRILKSKLRKGRICMVMYQGWGDIHEIKDLEWGHYAIAVGIEGRNIFLLDPSVYKDWGDGVGWRKLSLKEFQKRWVEKESGKIIKGWMLSIDTLYNFLYNNKT